MEFFYLLECDEILQSTAKFAEKTHAQRAQRITVKHKSPVCRGKMNVSSKLDIHLVSTNQPTLVGYSQVRLLCFVLFYAE